MPARSVLVVAAPTLDLIDGGPPRPGGPTLYAGHAAARRGCEAHALGPVGSEGLWLIARAHEALGVSLHPIESTGPPFTFHHTYRGGGARESRLAARPAVSALPPHLPAAHARNLRADAVLTMPVYGEVPPSALPLVSMEVALHVVDAQGYSRLLGRSWPHSLPAGSYGLLHYSTDDHAPPHPPGGVVLYTMGSRGAVLLVNGEVEARVPAPRRLLGDPTGAGDAYTALAACCALEEGRLTRACLEAAAEELPGVLDDAHAILEELAG